MREYLVCEVADNYGVSLCHARRFTDEEKAEYIESFRELGFIRIDSYPTIKLNGINWIDVSNILSNREPDGSFIGCSNSTYIVTEEEWNQLISLNDKKCNEKLIKEKSESIEHYKKIVQACESQEKLYTKEESIAKTKEWNDIHNEGGEGFVPHFYTIDEYEYAKKKLEELNK